MAAVHGWLLAFLAATVGVVETSHLYLFQWWSYPAATAEVAAAREAQWTILVIGSSQVYSGILPGEIERGLAQTGRAAEKVQALGIGGAVASTQLLLYRAVREGHRPRAVVITLAARDMTEHWDRQTLTVRAHASLVESWALAARAPRERWAFPWYALTRDLGVPLQALSSFTPVSRQAVVGWIERAGGGWPAPGHEGIGLGPMRGLMAGERLGLLRVQLERQAADAPFWIEELIGAVRADGAAPVVLVMPQSAWSTSRLPAAPLRRFEESIDALGRRMGVGVLRGLELDAALRERTFYLDSVDHLSRSGAIRVSRALGRAVGVTLGGSAAPADEGTDAPPDGAWPAPSCVETAGAEATQQLLEGWWPAELGGRWTQAVATAELGWPPGVTSAHLALRGFNWERHDVTFQVFVDDRLVLDRAVAPGPFTAQAPVHFVPHENPTLVRIERRPPFIPARIGMPDARELGVFVTSLCLTTSHDTSRRGQLHGYHTISCVSAISTQPKKR